MAELMTFLERRSAKIQYDENAKHLLALKPVLANILIRTVKDFEGMNSHDVEQLIEGDISIGCTPVNPGFTNEKNEQGLIHISGMNTESKVPDEGVRYFDILFYVNNPNILSKFIINVEAQKDDPSPYDVEMRGIFYSAREISSQLDRVFSGQDYNSMCKVYSIWICMNATENSIQSLRIAPKSLLGEPRWKDMYEILNVIIIRMKNTLDQDLTHELHRLLGALFVTELPIEEKEHILNNEFGIQIPNDGRRLIEEMCNLSEGIFEQGLECGIAQGLERGITQGLERGIMSSIRKLMKKGLQDEQIMDLLDVTNEQIKNAKYLLDHESN